MRFRTILLFILSAGTALRLYFVWTAPFSIPLFLTDTSTLWLMAKHITKGCFPLFFYGQYFLGPLEPLFMAFFFKIFGIKIYTLFLANVFFSCLFIISSYFLGKELKDRVTGFIMMLYSAFPASYFFLASVMPGGYWIEILLLGNVMLILALKIPKYNLGIRKTAYYILLGLAAGAGFWTHYMIFYYFLPIGLYLLINDRLKDFSINTIPAIISFFLISLPFWLFTFKYNFAPFTFKSQSSNTSSSDFLIVLTQNINNMFNINFSLNSLKALYISIISFIYCAAIIYFILVSVPRKRFFTSKNSLFIYLLFFITVIYVIFRTRVNLGGAPNHLMPIFTFLLAVLGYLFSSFYRKNKLICVFLLIIIPYNIWDICQLMRKQQHSSKEVKDSVYNRINFLKNNNIYRYIGSERDSRITVFFSNEDIIATAFLDYEYYPYSDIVESSDRIAFNKDEESCSWPALLKNISKSHSTQNGFYYNITPFPYKIKAITPSKWKAESNYNGNIVNFAFDRNFNKFWTSRYPKKNGMIFTIDMINIHTICKIQIFNMHHYINYPSSLKIQVSTDGDKWTDTAILETIQPLFWSGPRLYWHLIDGRVEVIFKPVEARFIRLTQIGEDSINPWEINEMFVYKYLDNEEFKIKDYVKDLKRITNLLIDKRINFVYADFWPSARIRQISKNSIQSLVPYTRFLPPRENMSCEVSLRNELAFVISKETASEFETILNEFELPYKKIIFKKYNCYYFEYLDKDFESMPSLFWIGNSVIKHSLKETSKWFCDRAKKAEKEGNIDKAIDYYKKAVKYCPKTFLAYQALAKYNIPKYKEIVKRRFTPKTNTSVKFLNGLEFLGYNIKGGKLKAGSTYKVNYFWTINKELKDNFIVFIYFIKNDMIVFQNDHELLFISQKPLKFMEGERFKENLLLQIPPNAEPGVYKIVMGLKYKDIGKRIKIIDPRNKRKTKEIIGKVEISEK